MSDEDLASKVNTETPWWAKAPVWLAAGIVGVPSFIALAAGYYIVAGVTRDLAVLTQYNLSELSSLSQLDTDQKQRWETVRRLLLLQAQTNLKICVHEAQNRDQVSECVEINETATDLLQKKQLSKPPQ